MWQKDGSSEAVDKGNLGSMQSFDCDLSLPEIHNYGTVTDNRDNNTYKVARLMDDKCWMIENLRIVNKTITSSDSDVSSSYTIPSSNISKFDVDQSGYSSKPNNQAAYVDSTYGGYYTWQVATAGTGSSHTSSGQNAPSSICPKGWKLPTGGSSSDLATLVDAYGGNNSTGSTNLRATPVPSFTYAGYILSVVGALLSQDENGNYWSSTAYNSVEAREFSLRDWDANPVTIITRVTGNSMRCVAQ